jgi:urease beta subunit
VVHITLTLHKSYTQFPVGTSKEQSPGDSQRACRRDVAEGMKVPYDGPAEVPVRLDAGRHSGVARVQMAGMRPVLSLSSRAAAAPLVWEAAAT